MDERELAGAIAKEVDKLGGRAYFVGGCVRDRLLGLENRDIDIEVYGVKADRLEQLLRKFGEVKANYSFGVFNIDGCDLDITMPRTEVKTGVKHNEFRTKIEPFLAIEEAAKRRDFTVNAIMENVLTGKIVDPVNGKSDLHGRVIRPVDLKKFSEDPLRVLRAARFAAYLDFTFDAATILLCRGMDLSSLTKERVFAEMKSTLLNTERPSIFFEALREFRQLDDWFPEIKNLIDVPQNETAHKEGDVWRHTMMVLDEAVKKRDSANNPLGLMLSALCHDLGKAVTVTVGEDGVHHSYGHEKEGVPLAGAFLERLTSSKALKDYVLNMVELHQEPHKKAQQNSSMKSFNHMFDKSVCPLDLLALVECDSLGRTPPLFEEKKVLYDRFSQYCDVMAKPFVSGKDLIAAGIKPNNHFKELLEYAHKLRLADVDKNNALKQVLAYGRKNIRKENGNEK